MIHTVAKTRALTLYMCEVSSTLCHLWVRFGGIEGGCTVPANVFCRFTRDRRVEPVTTAFSMKRQCSGASEWK